MKNLIFLVCCAIFVKSSWCDGISIVGSKYIRPNRPYTVGFVNPMNTLVKLNLSLNCNEFGEDVFKNESRLSLRAMTGMNVQFSVPSIAETSECTFSAINDGGKTVVNHVVNLETPDKTLSIFIQTDKPVYKPGDELRFRVVVVDIEMKPVTNIKTIEVLLEDAKENSVRHWTFAKLNKGVFETSYQMAAVPVLGRWNITVTVDDNTFENKKTQSFEVKEYVLPKFSVKVRPTKTLLIKDKMISLNVEAKHTFGQHVEGKVYVELFLEEYSKRSSFQARQNINGNEVVVIRLQDELETKDEDDHALVKIAVAVTDSFTNATVNVTQLIPVYLKPFEISLVKPSLYYRPNAPYHFKLSVKDHMGLPAEQGKQITISIDDIEKSASLDDQGLASFVIPTPNNVEELTVSAVFDSEEYEDIGVIEGLESSSSQYLQIQPKQDRIKISKKSTFTISSNEPFAQFTYFIVAKGSILDFMHVKSKKRTKHVLTLSLTEAMAPTATLVVFLIKDGQFVSNYLDLNFVSFGNDFEFKLDKLEDEQYRPDEEIYFEGKAQKDSIIFFQAIDESALLLGHTEYGLTKQGILEDLDQYRGKGRDNEKDWFHSMGLFFKSHSVGEMFGSSRNKRSPYYHSQGQRKTQKAVLLRLDFPESWLWRNHSMNNKDIFEIQDFVPDTITSWHVTAFALSPTRGLAIMNHPRKFTVGKPFYMIAHLPYSIKRGEVALIQVTLYNFLGNAVTTDVTLFNKNDEIEFVEGSSKDNTRRTKAIISLSNKVKAVSFLIRAKKLGEIAIKIEAVNSLVSDGLEHLLRVTPESHLYKKNEARFIELQGFKDQKFDIACDIPRASDPGSVKIEVALDHDFVGIPADHSESLIKIPNGCGDLNLLTLIPNIVALDHLSSTDKIVDEPMKQKAIDYLIKGYDNQLKYRSSNGAFRQWNNETGKESIFLTALVANSFSTASKHITVNQTVVKDAFSWLVSKQKPDGCFEEIGEVVYSPMQDSSSSVALTAFVVAAIQENSNFSREYEPQVDKAVKYLADKFDGLSREYDRAVATYALSLAKHPKQFNYLEKLVQDTIKNNTERYWDEGSLSVEIAGYALLSYIAQDKPMQGVEIYAWLNQQRLSSGEFGGVQSTFVGLKAMSKMAQILTRRRVNYRFQIKSKTSSQKWNFDIDPEKALSTTEFIIPDDTLRTFEIEFSGTGYGFFQLTYQYHLNIAAPKPSFNLILEEQLQANNHEVQKLKICLSYRQHELYATSGKTLVEIYLPSGLIVNDNSVLDLSYNKAIKNTMRSSDGSAMFVYYNSVGTNQVCFMVTAYRQFKIAMHRPAYVVVYDTEDRTRFALKTYEGKVLQLCDICEDEDCNSLKC